MNYVGLPGKEKIGLLIQLKAFDPKARKKVEIEIAWAYLPLFVSLENENNTYSLFVNTGIY